MKILIVDDDIIALELLRDTLLDGGHDVVSAENGRQALEIAKNYGPQIIVSDWEMPELDGVELAQQIRRGGHDSYVYFILLTSHNNVEQRVQGLSAGADDFISKPFEPTELLARIASAERILSLETRDVTIFALAKLAESRDPETGAHLERVMNYSRVLATSLISLRHFTDQIDAEYVRLLYSTSPLHDIGKVGIPDGILLKPGRLTESEFDIMKSHTTIGAKTLSAAIDRFPNTKFLIMARDIAASHHERFDGTGYPNGLIGDEIPLCARIVAVADIYDALTSKRAYKDAFTHEVSKEIITKETGSHLDPRVVEAFLAAEQEFMAIRKLYNEENDTPISSKSYSVAGAGG